MFAISILPNTIITAEVNAHSPLWYLSTEDHGELIKDILLNSHHITLNTSIPTRLPTTYKSHTTSFIRHNKPTSSDITTTSADLHDCTSWQAIHSLTYDHLPLRYYLQYTSQDQNNLLFLHQNNIKLAKGRLDIIYTT